MKISKLQTTTIIKTDHHLFTALPVTSTNPTIQQYIWFFAIGVYMKYNSWRFSYSVGVESISITRLYRQNIR